MRYVSRFLCGALVALSVAALTACGGGSDGSSSSLAVTPQSQTGLVPLMLSDASSEDWALIGVKIVGVALVPQSGGPNVPVYSPATPTALNLVQLDQLSELLGNVTVPVGTYSGAVLTISANPSDIMLTASADPEAGFAGTPGASIPSGQIQIQHTQGTAPSLTTAVNVKFVSPLVVTTSQNNALDLEVDLGHPAFIVGHVPPVAAGSTVWSVNFEGPVRHLPIADLTRLVLRHAYGTVSAVANDNTAITITRVVPTLPIASPETSTSTTQSLQILADATNGTLYYDLDGANTPVTLTNFSSVASTLVNKNVRIAARYQSNGTLVATRIWSSSQFAKIWVSPEGHVLHVNTSTNVFHVMSETGASVPVLVNANTQFFFRTPQSALADATPIGTGPAFLAAKNLVRGFKVHVSVVDPLAANLVAQSVDIETAAYDGRISGANSVGYTATRNFNTAIDNYSVTLPYIGSGYKWWNFAYPTVVNSGANAINDFIAATNGAVSFGGTAPAVNAYGVTFARWGDAANATGWSAPWTVLEPTRLPLGFVASGLVNGSGSSTFTMTVPNGTRAATIDVATGSGSATLFYQIDRTRGVITVSAVDVTTAAGLTTLSTGLANGTPVKVFGVPQADGTLKAYVLTYYTGTLPTTG